MDPRQARRARWLERRIPPPAVALAFGALMWALARALPGLRVEIPAAAWTGAALGATGLALDAAALLALRAARTTPNPMKPEAATTLVTTGVYAWTRNPMYLGWLPIALGWAVFLEHPLTLIAVPLFVLYLDRFQIAPEERALAAKFGAAYERYRARVRRWL